jgi:hypothetical protein
MKARQHSKKPNIAMVPVPTLEERIKVAQQSGELALLGILGTGPPFSDHP